MIDDIIKKARVSSNGRRFFSGPEKRVIVSECEKSGLSVPEFCRRHGLIVNILYRWRRDAVRGAVMGIQNESELYTKTEIEALRSENDELKKLVAEQALDIKILKKNREDQAKRLWDERKLKRLQKNSELAGTESSESLD